MTSASSKKMSRETLHVTSQSFALEVEMCKNLLTCSMHVLYSIYSLVIVSINSCKWYVVQAIAIVQCVSCCSIVSGELNTKQVRFASNAE